MADPGFGGGFGDDPPAFGSGPGGGGFGDAPSGDARNYDGDGGAADGGGDDRNCNHCNQVGHLKRDCPDAPPMDTTCRHCHQEGHMKRDCPEIPEDQRGPGACFSCGEVGHNKSECPTKAPDICRNCGEEGHRVSGCTNPRKLDIEEVPVMEPDAAWALMKKASDERDMDDFRDALKMYTKAVPNTTYPQLEKGFREQGFKVYIIGYERDEDLSQVFTLMNLQGKLGNKYQIGYYFSPKAQRSTMKPGWPATPEDNMERLADAGIPVDTLIPKCSNCNELGHTIRGCKEERAEPAHKVEVRCSNCEELGHRPRDCDKPRPDRYACKNCNQRGHNAKDCDQPRNADNVECKNCSKMGHFSKDCPDRTPMLCNNCGEEGHKKSDCVNPANPAMMKCRNCDEMGHSGRECPKPRDYSRVTCQNCQKTGHTKVRCKEPVAVVEESGDFGGGGGFGGGGDTGGFGDADTGGFSGGDTGFGGGGFGESAAPEPIATGSDGGFADW